MMTGTTETLESKRRVLYRAIIARLNLAVLFTSLLIAILKMG